MQRSTCKKWQHLKRFCGNIKKIYRGGIYDVMSALRCPFCYLFQSYIVPFLLDTGYLVTIKNQYIKSVFE